MTNPALLLAKLCESWRIDNTKLPERVRFNADPESLEFWQMHRLAVRYLDELETALSSLKATGADVSFFEDSFPAWNKAVFSYTTPWHRAGTNTGDGVMSKMELQMLKALGAHLEIAKMIPTFTGSSISELITTVGELRKMTVENRELADNVRRYLLGLIVEVERVLNEHEAFSTVQIRQKVMELLGAVITTTSTLSDLDERQNWKAKAGTLAVVISGALGMKVLEIASDVTIHVLTQPVPGVTG